MVISNVQLALSISLFVTQLTLTYVTFKVLRFNSRLAKLESESKAQAKRDNRIWN